MLRRLADAVLERLETGARWAQPVLSSARLSVSAVCGASAVFCVLNSEPAHADNTRSMRPERVAPVSGPTPSVQRTRRAGSSKDVWLLVQSAPPSGLAVGSSEEALAVFPASAPESLDEEVAKAHGLEVVGRSTISSVGLRLVRYRIPDARALSTVVDRLKADPRVETAQANFSYGLSEHKARPIEVSKPSEPAVAPHQRGKDDSRAASLASVEPGPKQKLARRKASGRSESPRAIKRLSSRVGGVGDVLLGGL